MALPPALLFGALSDKIGRRPVYLSGAIFSAAFIVPFFALFAKGTPSAIFFALALALGVGHTLMYGAQAAFFAELFGTEVRCSGASIGYHCSTVLAGGMAPVVAAALIHANHGSPTLVAAYVALACGVTALSVWLAPETYRGDLSRRLTDDLPSVHVLQGDFGIE